MGLVGRGIEPAGPLVTPHALYRTSCRETTTPSTESEAFRRASRPIFCSQLLPSTMIATVKRTAIHVPKSACPYNPPFVFASRVTILSIDTGPLPICQALPCFAQRQRRDRCR